MRADVHWADDRAKGASSDTRMVVVLLLLLQQHPGETKGSGFANRE